MEDFASTWLDQEMGNYMVKGYDFAIGVKPIFACSILEVMLKWG